MNIVIPTLAPDEVEKALPQLVALFQDAIASGAALGFLPPLTEAAAQQFWRGVQASVAAGQTLLFVARDTASGDVLGTVQLQLAPQSNGRHRAEVAKMMVHTRARRQGIGRLLLQALQERAAAIGRTTLVLDTRQGDAAEQLYQSVGFRVSGVIPDYAESADGSLHATVVYFKLLR